MRIGELFSGYGGLGMGVQSVLGGDIMWHSDIDKGACKILAHRYPGVPNLGDITTVDWSQVEPVDVLTGGFPCQDVSGAGKRAGMKPDNRSGLWSHFAYAIDQLRPELVVIENVRGLVSAEAHSNVEPCPWCMGEDPDRPLRALGAVLGDLADIGFDADWVGLPASRAGAPHGRFREFIAAYPQRRGRGRWAREARRAEVGRAAAHGHLEGPLLPTPRHSDGDKGLRSRAGAAAEFARKGVGADLTTMLTLLPTPAVNDMGDGKTVEAWDAWTAKMKAEHDNGNGHGASLAIELQRIESGWGPFTAAIERWERVTGNPAPAPHEAVRVREWMMGLPDGWVTAVPDITDRECKRALGNGVVPQQCAAALRLMLGQAAAA